MSACSSGVPFFTSCSYACLLYTSSLLSYYSGVEDFCEHADDIILWSGCDTTADVAEQMLDDGLISDETLRRYFDSVQYGRDLSMEGDFVETKDGVFELVR